MNNLTEQAFARTLKEIMAKKSFDKVTVTELVRFLNVNRQTFYYHFKDLYDLLEWIYIT
ncbi:TetR family transcriptional regulator, partial [Streptococcus mutans]|uniref:TetR family transcriptional regulator n=1 Tax=Streptococcus mutans TaxID=1309 RepID=UPI00037297FC